MATWLRCCCCVRVLVTRLRCCVCVCVLFGEREGGTWRQGCGVVVFVVCVLFGEGEGGTWQQGCDVVVCVCALFGEGKGVHSDRIAVGWWPKGAAAAS